MNLNWEIQKNEFDEPDYFEKVREHEGISWFIDQDCNKFNFDHRFEDFDSIQYINEDLNDFTFENAVKDSNIHQPCMSKEVGIQQISTVQKLGEIGSNQQDEKQSSNTEELATRRESTNQDLTLSDSNGKLGKRSHWKSETTRKGSFSSDSINQSAECSPSLKKLDEEMLKEEDDEDMKQDEDPEYDYKVPRKHKFEYNKRKDVILKTILRKCRRILQDEFNNLTDYFQNRKLQGHQFLKECVLKYFNFLNDKPEQLDLVFYIGAMLYPQEMSRGVDCFFDCDKKERVKQRKIYRAKIQKVHDVLYRYSHEKMDYFVKVPELSYLYVVFYKKESLNDIEDHSYINGAQEIFERCKKTLESANILI